MSFNIDIMKKRLLIKYPFFGSILANTSFIVTDSLQTAATDGKNIYYNPNFVNSLKEKEQTFLFAHEVCHIAFNHIYRSEGKNQKLWNIATDGVINSLLSQKDGLPIIEGGVNIEDAFKYDAEELYEKLLEEQEKNNSSNSNESSQSDDSENLEKENTHDAGHDTHSMWSEAIKKKKEQRENPNSENIDNKKTEQKDDDKIQEEKEKMAKIGEKKIFEENKVMRDKQLDKLRKSLAEQSTKYGVSTNFVNRHIDQIGSSKPLIDWTRLLKEAIKYDEDWSYQSPIVDGGIVIPDRIDLERSETEILLDTSGSIDDTLLRNFLRECKNILKSSKVKVGCFDTNFYGFTDIRTSNDIENLQFFGGGGTDFDVAVNSFSKNATNRIIFTDGWADMPQKKVDAIWIVFGGKKINPRGGRVIHITPEQLDRLYSYEIESETKGRSR